MHIYETTQEPDYDHYYAAIQYGPDWRVVKRDGRARGGVIIATFRGVGFKDDAVEYAAKLNDRRPCPKPVRTYTIENLTEEELKSLTMMMGNVAGPFYNPLRKTADALWREGSRVITDIPYGHRMIDKEMVLKSRATFPTTK